MGKRLIPQRRGRGTATYRFPGFRFKGSPAHLSTAFGEQKGVVADLVHMASHTAPLALITFSNNKQILVLAPEGIKVGDVISFNTAELRTGYTLSLKDIPEGTLVYNLECTPGDGGKLVRSSGGAARVANQVGGKIRVLLPSKKVKTFHPSCRASIGIIAGGGRKEKPLVKAGNAHHKKRARNKLYPRTSGIAMNALTHPFGSSSSSQKGRPLIAKRHAHPGGKVGSLRPKRTGRKKR